MSTEYYPAYLEIKAVDLGSRVLEAHVAVFNNIDRVDDVIDVKAFDRTLDEKKPADVGVFIGHNMSNLPVGIPLTIKPDGKGLFTQTKVFKTSDGDALLQTAKELLAAGQHLGASIGYKTRDSVVERREGKSVRRLLDIDLIEYSFAPSQAIANPEALVSAVKTAVKQLSEGTDTGGGFAVGSDYIDHPHDSFNHLHNHADGRSHAHLHNHADGSSDHESDAHDHAPGKTVREGAQQKAELDAAARNNLNDSDFAYIDSEGGRHLPIHDAAHVRAAMARFNQTNFGGAAAKAKAWRKILAAARKFNIDVSDDSQPGKTVGYPYEQKADGDHMKAVKSLLAMHKKAYAMHYTALGAHGDAMDAHSDAIDEMKAYQLAIRNGDFDDDGDDIPVPSEKLFHWISQLQVKAGARMSSAHLGQLHDALDSLRSLHDSQCKDPDCVHRMDDDGQDGMDGDGGGSADGEGTDEGPGNSKTFEIGSPEWFRQLTAELEIT